jgi:hypothetical protein
MSRINNIGKRILIWLTGLIVFSNIAFAKNSLILPEAMENILVFIFNTLPEGVKSE